MKANRLRCLPLLIPICLCGCATSALWQNGRLNNYNEPADNPNLRLFASPRQSDVLVVYEEYCERSGSIRTRAYWLNENEDRIERRLAPKFTEVKAARRLDSIPVFDESNPPLAEPPPLYAVSTNSRSFTMFFVNGTSTDYMLPVYDDGTGRMRMLFFTPAAVAVDATVVGAVVGAVVGYGMLEGLASSSHRYR